MSITADSSSRRPRDVTVATALSTALKGRLVDRLSPGDALAVARAAAVLTTLPRHSIEPADQGLTPLGLLTAGLFLVAITPTITVLLVAVAHGHGRRCREA